MSEIGRINIEVGVLEALGITREELEDQGLRLFVNRAYDRGFKVRLLTRSALTTPGHLTLTMDRAPSEKPND